MPHLTGPQILDPAQAIQALRLVRLAVESWARNGLRIAGAPPADSFSQVRCPVFVTLSLSGRLRGCVGSLEAHVHLGESLVDCALGAAFRDSRFPPIAASDLPLLAYEISLLTQPQALEDPASVVVGVDGLLAEIAGRRGLLLPQVAAQQGWDRETFLDQTCLKAGAKAGDWRRDCRLWVFQAQILSEEDPTA